MTDLSLASPLVVMLLDGGKPIQDNEDHIKTMHKACLDFFDRYLKGWDGWCCTITTSVGSFS